VEYLVLFTLSVPFLRTVSGLVGILSVLLASGPLGVGAIFLFTSELFSNIGWVLLFLRLIVCPCKLVSLCPTVCPCKLVCSDEKRSHVGRSSSSFFLFLSRTGVIGRCW